VPANNPTQAAVDALFPPATGACPFPHTLNLTDGPGNTYNDDPLNLCRISNQLTSGGSAPTNFRTNRDGTIFTGLADAARASPGAYRFNGPVYNVNDICPAGRCRAVQGSGDLDGSFQGLPGFVMQPDGRIKENVLYQWASSPLERLSAFANGHFDVADNVRVTGQAMVTRTKTESSLGLAAANINQWGAGIPFGTALYRGNSNTYFDIPDSLIDVNGNGVADAGIDRTHPSYTPTGRYGVQCEGPPTAAMPWLDNLPGCTNSEAWPISPEVYNLMRTRPRPNDILWASREPDWMRDALGAARSTTNVTTTMSFSLGLEGDTESGSHSWDISLYTGRSDNVVNQLGSMRLTTYRDVLSSPNFGRNATFDSNPWEAGGFAESVPTCTSGLPIADNRAVSADCLQMISPALKNVREMTQTILEGNLVGDLAEMKAGPLQYALGMTYRENGFDFVPDNLSDIQNEVDPIAGLFPNERSNGEFDVTEIYGELLVPIIADGPKGVEHFNLELGGRISDWSMENMPNLETYKALIDWAISPRYRIRGGFNRAFRAPNLGELFIRRTQLFGGGGSRDWCSTGLDSPSTWSATNPDRTVLANGTVTNPGTPTAQTLRSRQICQQLMGSQGATFYYDPARTQDRVGGTGIPNTFGNPNLREEQADTWTIGVAMDILEDWSLTVDWYQIEIKNMIALEGADTTYQYCLDMQFNPTGSLAVDACQRIFRNPTTGGGALVDRTFTNEGMALFSGVDVALNWRKQLADGGGLNLNISANAPVHEITQDRATVAAVDWAGYNFCALQLQCQNYDYRLFTTIGYSRDAWNLALRHQYWPELQNNACRTNPTGQACVYNSLPNFGLLSLSGNMRFDRYTVSMGIENLADREPPCIGFNPGATPFYTECTHTGDGSTYDPLGRRFFVSVNMEF
jgi:outer membrane receptor protein involved in Fe transport